MNTNPGIQTKESEPRNPNQGIQMQEFKPKIQTKESKPRNPNKESKSKDLKAKFLKHPPS